MTDLSNKDIASTLDIGGYFGLELPEYGDPFPSAIKFQSGRSALRATLESAGIERVMLPAYICEAVIKAVVGAGADFEMYFLDDFLYPKGLPSALPDKCALLYVNYFGLCKANIVRLLRDIPSDQLIVDNSQALFALPSIALASIYSPRKFVGLPDGGLLITFGLEVKIPEDEDQCSLGRMKYLFLRSAYTAQSGYHDYVESEKSLADTRPRRMSRLTKRLLASIDMTNVKRRRRDNFQALATQLDSYNLHKWELDSESVPLCYPLMVNRDVEYLKKRLTRKGIYIPTYWPEAKQRFRHSSIEHHLTNCCLAVPCDQRYSHSQMSYLADKIVAGLDI